jgi:Gpi18-like mannosyltransferase
MAFFQFEADKSHESEKTADDIKKLSCTITAACLIIFIALFYYWLAVKAYSSPAGRFGAIINAALFAALGVRFVPIWVSDWAAAETKKDKADTKSTAVKIFFILLLVDIGIILFIYLLQIISGKGAPFPEALKLWTATDSGHYLDIARDWYLSTGHWDRLVQLVFLPGYPLLIRLLNPLIGNHLYTGMIISGLCFAGAGAMLYRLIRLDYSHEIAVRTLKFLCILPGAFFFASPMSESLFLLLSVSCFYYLREKDWFLACLLAGWASYTRSLGLVLAVPILFEMISEDIKPASREQPPESANNADKWKRIFKYASLLFVFFGFGGYLFINYQVAGNPFQFLIYQKEHWSQSLGFFFNTAAYQIDYAISCVQQQELHTLMGLWLPNLLCIFSSLVIMIAAVKKLRPGYTVYFLAYYIIAIGATWLLSGPRYLLTLFPLSLALSLISEKRRTNWLLTIAYSIFFVLYSYMFVNRWSVW